MKKNQRGISLIAVSLGMMLVAFVGISLLMYFRFGHFPLESLFAKAGQSVATVSKSVSTLATGNSNAKSDFDGAIRRCTVNGKIVYSNVECKDNSSAKAMKLHDSSGFEAPKVPVVDKEDKGDPLNIEKKISENLAK